MVAIRRVAVTVLGIAAATALAVSGCSSATSDPQGTTPSEAETGSPSDTPPAETTPPVEDEWAVTPSGIGPFEIGMRYADALTARHADVSELCEGVAQVEIPSEGETIMWVTASERDPASTLAQISVSVPADSTPDPESGPVTDAGIGLGSTIEELEGAYPDVRELDDTGVPDRVMYYLEAESGGMIFTTTSDADMIWQISVTTGEIPAYEPCA